MTYKKLASALVCGVCIVAMATPANAQTRAYNIPAGSLKSALDAYARQSGRPIIYKADQIRHSRSQGARGTINPEAALEMILGGTSFRAQTDSSGAVAIVLKINPLGEGKAGSAAASSESAEIVVTGTRLRGGQSPSPTTVVTAKAIKDDGYSNLGDVVRSLPQNFRGGQNPGVIDGGGVIANQNLSGGSGLNLRGLGPDASLTLLNGRRLTANGLFQAVDISAIPIDAVERIEVVADGASAIYGSDAVAGVGNVLLKRDFEGFTIRGRVAGATDGGLATREVDATGGAVWASGGAIAAFQRSSVDPIYASQRDYTADLLGPRTIYASNRLTSGLLSAHQSLGAGVEFRLDAMYSDRRSESRGRDTVELSLTQRHTKNLVIAPTVEVAIGSDWKLSVGGNWGRDQYLGTISYTSTAADPYQPYTKDLIENESYAADINAEGPLFQLPGGAARLAVGGGFRHVSLRERNLVSAQILEQGVQRNGFAYAELGLPFVSPGLGIAGIKLFSLTAALRAEEYNSFGRVVTPKVGFIYSPGAGLTLKGSWAKSFKAPTLLQQRQSALLYAFPTAAFPSGANYPADAQVLLEFGGNPNLKPERSQSLTFTFDYQPTFAPGLDVSLTYFHIDYRNRVVQPLPDFSNALDNPIFAPYIVYAPTSDRVANAFAGAQFIDVTGGFDGSKVVAILQDRYTNAARQKASGIDAVINYAHAVAGGTATFSSSGSYLNLSQQTGVGQPTNDISGKAFYPATFNGRAGLTIDKMGFSTSAFVNYTSSVSLRDLVLARPQRRSGAFTTVDLNARYNTGDHHGSLANIEIAVSIQNLFNRAPPLYAQSGSLTAPYDSTNYSSVGRLISLSLAKHF